MSGMRRRSVGLAMAILLLVATACGSDDKTSSAPTEEPAGPELVVDAPDAMSVVEDAPEKYGVVPPLTANVATGYGNVNPPVFETLVALAPNFTIQPLLATSWELRPPNTWRFHLQDGVTFHNGAAFDAAAVVDSLKRRADPTAPTSLGPDSGVVVDRLTVDLTPTKENAHLPEQMAHPLLAIHAPGTTAGTNTSPQNRPTGTGPFKFSKYVQGSLLEVERYDRYWGEKAKSRKITFRFQKADNTRVTDLEGGDVDAIYDLPRELASQYADHPDIVVKKSAPGAYSALLLNHRGTAPYDILGDLQVRRAVALSIDRATLVENVWKGNAEVMNTVIPAPILGTSASKVTGFPYDPAQAEGLLSAAGWLPGPDGVRVKNGRRLELTLVVANAELQRPAPVLVQSQLKAIGVDVKLDEPTGPAYGEKLVGGQGDMFA